MIYSPTTVFSGIKCHVFFASSGFWNDCKLPDYEEVVGHPPTPPPPYSEDPVEVTAAALPQAGQPDAIPLPHMPEDSRQESQAPCQAAENAQASPPVAEEDEEDELVTRRRHVTGDSGIEVCVCQLDVEESCGLEEEEEGDEEPRMCRASGQDCCSGRQQQSFRQKEHSSELPSTSTGTSTSTGDHLVWPTAEAASQPASPSAQGLFDASLN